MRLLELYALSFLGVNYKWGGSNPISGMDCSGFVQELLRSCGMDPPGDQTAQGLFDHFSTYGRGSFDSYHLGALIFFGKSVSQITHVGMLLDRYQFIEAGGGNSTVIDKTTADNKNAFVRISLIKQRTDQVSIIRPYYRTIGEL